jgi:hypothetical protein
LTKKKEHNCQKKDNLRKKGAKLPKKRQFTKKRSIIAAPFFKNSAMDVAASRER